MKLNLFIYLFFLLISLSSCKKETVNSITCPISVLIDNTLFDNSSSDEFEYVDVQVENNCLVLTIRYGAGCEKIQTQLLAKKILSVESSPLELKFILTDKDDCEKLITEKIYFDLTLLQVTEKNSITLKLENWQEELVYQY